MKTRRTFSVLVVLLIFLAGIAAGIYWRKVSFSACGPGTESTPAVEQKGGAEAGRWKAVPTSRRGGDLSSEQTREIRQLRSIGYAAGSQPAPDADNVTVLESGRAYEGMNLIVSGHAPEAILTDMEGRVLHRWICDAQTAWPDFDPDEHYGAKNKQFHTYWRRAHVFENGDLLAIFDGIGIVKLNRDSEVLWANRNGAHHDLYVAGDGRIYVLTRTSHINKDYNVRYPILEDYIVVLGPEGEELQRVSVLELFRGSPFEAVLQRLNVAGDILHSNTIELFEDPDPQRLGVFKPGTVLLSILFLDMVCAVDIEARTVYWAESDLWRRQHQPTLLANGNMLVLDNQGGGSESKILEIDPATRAIEWSYTGGMDGAFHTPTCGSCQRLPNGNTLITESDPGRAFEVTPDKTIVWEYINPHRAGPHDEFIATLFEVVRLPPDFGHGWMAE
jgi:hypothetical protein